MIIHLMQSDLRSCGHTCVMMVYASLSDDQLLPSLSSFDHPEGLSLHDLACLLHGQSYHIEESFEWTHWTHFPLIIRCALPIPHFIVIWERRGKMVHLSDPSQPYDEWRSLSSLKTLLPSQLLTVNLPKSHNHLHSLWSVLLIVLCDLVSMYSLAQGREVMNLLLVLGVSGVVHWGYQYYNHQHSTMCWKRQLEHWLLDETHRVEEYQLTQLFHVKNAHLYERANLLLIELQLFGLFFTFALITHWFVLTQVVVWYGTIHVIPWIASRYSFNRLVNTTVTMTESYQDRQATHVVDHYRNLQTQYRRLKRWQWYLTLLNLIVPLLTIILGEWLPLHLVNIQLSSNEYVWYVGVAYSFTLYTWIGMQLIPHSSANNATHMI